MEMKMIRSFVRVTRSERPRGAPSPGDGGGEESDESGCWPAHASCEGQVREDD